MTATEFLLRKQLRNNTTYIRIDGEGYRLYNGELIREQDFLNATALPERPYISELNPCKKHQYLNVEGNCIENLNALIV